MTWVEAIQSKWPFGSPPERRSDSQIDNDLEDEFAFHLEMKTRELIESGHNSEVARGLAIDRFGNIELIKRRCRRIALEERIMWQRIHIAFTILFALALVFTIYFATRQVAIQRDLAVQSRMVAETERNEAMQQSARAKAVEAFLADIFTSADPQRHTSMKLKEAIDRASERIEREFAGDPGTAAGLRRAIEEARKK